MSPREEKTRDWRKHGGSWTGGGKPPAPTYADGDRVRIKQKNGVRRYRKATHPPFGEVGEYVPVGTEGTVVRGDMFGGRMIRVRLDDEQHLIRLIEAEMLEPVQLEGSNS